MPFETRQTIKQHYIKIKTSQKNVSLESDSIHFKPNIMHVQQPYLIPSATESNAFFKTNLAAVDQVIKVYFLGSLIHDTRDVKGRRRKWRKLLNH